MNAHRDCEQKRNSTLVAQINSEFEQSRNTKMLFPIVDMLYSLCYKDAADRMKACSIELQAREISNNSKKEHTNIDIQIDQTHNPIFRNFNNRYFFRIIIEGKIDLNIQPEKYERAHKALVKQTDLSAQDIIIGLRAKYGVKPLTLNRTYYNGINLEKLMK
jgi:uncharacterized protein YkwD